MTVEMMQALVAEMKNEQEVVFFKIRNSCHVLAVLELAQDAQEDAWGERDITYLEQAKNYLDFLLHSESIVCKINYQHGVVQALRKQGDMVELAMHQILIHTIEKFLKMPSKEYGDIQACGTILWDYADLLDSLAMISYLNEDDEDSPSYKVSLLLTKIKDRIDEQLWHVYEALNKLLKTSSDKPSALTVAWIQTCLFEHEEVLLNELGMWMFNRLMKSCIRLLQELPSPDFENLSDVEKAMIAQIALAEEIDEDDNNDKDVDVMDDMPF